MSVGKIVEDGRGVCCKAVPGNVCKRRAATTLDVVNDRKYVKKKRLTGRGNLSLPMVRRENRPPDSHDKEMRTRRLCRKMDELISQVRFNRSFLLYHINFSG